ncbi:hypothetical protein DFH06DRAFT_1478541 [Mycena polygramma]|nr:hypothetical protein DFH06DRAFT_1478541 [Mycena polygramma]
MFVPVDSSVTRTPRCWRASRKRASREEDPEAKLYNLPSLAQTRRRQQALLEHNSSAVAQPQETGEEPCMALRLLYCALVLHVRCLLPTPDALAATTLRVSCFDTPRPLSVGRVLATTRTPLQSVWDAAYVRVVEKTALFCLFRPRLSSNCTSSLSPRIPHQPLVSYFIHGMKPPAPNLCALDADVAGMLPGVWDPECVMTNSRSPPRARYLPTQTHLRVRHCPSLSPDPAPPPAGVRIDACPMPERHHRACPASAPLPDLAYPVVQARAPHSPIAHFLHARRVELIRARTYAGRDVGEDVRATVGSTPRSSPSIIFQFPTNAEALCSPLCHLLRSSASVSLKLPVRTLIPRKGDITRPRGAYGYETSRCPASYAQARATRALTVARLLLPSPASLFAFPACAAGWNSIGTTGAVLVEALWGRSRLGSRKCLLPRRSVWPGAIRRHVKHAVMERNSLDRRPITAQDANTPLFWKPLRATRLDTFDASCASSNVNLELPASAESSTSPISAHFKSVFALLLSPPISPLQLMYLYPHRPTAAQSKARAATARNNTWRDNVINGGPLPVHDLHQPSRVPAIEDRDPPRHLMESYQRAFADANENGDLLTMHKNNTELSPCPHPSSTTANFEIFKEPSGFRLLPLNVLPHCPHNANPDRNEDDCRMRAHTYIRDGRVTYYLQVPPQSHACSFISVLKHRDQRPLFPTPFTGDAVKHETQPMLLTPPVVDRPLAYKPATRTKRGAKTKTRSNPSAKGLALGRRPVAVGLNSIAGPSTSRALGAPIPALVIDLVGDDDDAPSPPLPPPRFSADEAATNLIGDPELLRLTHTHRLFQNDNKSYENSFWMLDGPGVRPYPNPLFPPRLSPYSSGDAMAVRVAEAGQCGPLILNEFAFNVATTDGVSSAAWDGFTSIMRVCSGCGNHFTSRALNDHLLIDGNDHRCGNHPQRPVASPVESPAYGKLLTGRPFMMGPHPSRSRSEKARYIEYGYLTALGIALSAVNTVLGLPDDIFNAVLLGIIPCPDCSRVRTVHAHLTHRPGGVCVDMGPGRSSFVAMGNQQVTEVRDDGERSVFTVED